MGAERSALPLGYIILKHSENLKKIKCDYGQVHGKCYKAVFKQDPDRKVLGGGGFGYLRPSRNSKKPRVWKFNSSTFNVGGEYHDNDRAMSEKEKQCILAAIENWKGWVQNTHTEDIAKAYGW